MCKVLFHYIDLAISAKVIRAPGEAAVGDVWKQVKGKAHCSQIPIKNIHGSLCIGQVPFQYQVPFQHQTKIPATVLLSCSLVFQQMKTKFLWGRI